MLGLITDHPFAGHSFGREIVPFVSVMAKRRRPPFAVPLRLPADGDWCVKILACQDRFVIGLHRREMKAITCLGQLESLLGVPITTRGWSTILEIGRAFGA